MATTAAAKPALSASWAFVGSGAAGEPISASVSGDVLADLLSSGGSGGGSGGGGVRGKLGDSATLATSLSAAARTVEEKHEIVALLGDRLAVNYDNYRRFRTATDATAPTMVVSFLGEARAGV
jgi:hypothetical protein